MYYDQGIADQKGDGCKGGIGSVQPGLFVRCAARARVVPLCAFRVVADMSDPIVSISICQSEGDGEIKLVHEYCKDLDNFTCMRRCRHN